MSKKLNIIILYGGESGEHEVSCISACSVFKNINLNLYNPILIGITQKGLWYLQYSLNFNRDKDLKKLPILTNEDNSVHALLGKGFFANGKIIPCDFIFPVLHGTYGEDGTIQGLLELLHLPYAGSGVVGSSVGMDKVIAKRVWESCNIPVVPFLEIYHSQFTNKAFFDDELNKIEEKLAYPLFVKPVNAGSSVGAGKANNRKELLTAIETAFTFDSRILIEIYINAREVECAVIGNENPHSFLPGEIIASHEFYDYDAKYNDPEGAKLRLEADLPIETQKYIVETAEKAYKAIMAEGFSRVDFFIDKETNKIYLNEINTLPGFTHISMFPKMCENAGIPYQDLISRIIQLGFDREKVKKTKTAISS